MRPRLIIPAAGEGSRFSDAGYIVPKPFLPYRGASLLENIVRMFPSDWETTIGIRSDHLSYACLLEGSSGPKFSDHPAWCMVPGKTDGAACTVGFILNQTLMRNGFEDFSFVVVNSDNMFACDPSKIAPEKNVAKILVFPVNDRMTGVAPIWSYAKMDRHYNITEVREKSAISDWATAGAYSFPSAVGFLRALDEMVAQKDTVRGEYYLAPIYNRLVRSGVKVVGVPMDQCHMMSFGVPAEYEKRLADTKTDSWLHPSWIPEHV